MQPRIHTRIRIALDAIIEHDRAWLERHVKLSMVEDDTEIETLRFEAQEYDVNWKSLWFEVWATRRIGLSSGTSEEVKTSIMEYVQTPPHTLKERIAAVAKRQKESLPLG